MKTTNLW